MPRRLHSETRRFPASVSPAPVSGKEGKRKATPSANAFGRLQTRPSERRPCSYSSARLSSSGVIGSAPSKWRIAASGPPANAASISAVVCAMHTSPPATSSSSSSAIAAASRFAYQVGTGSGSGSAYGGLRSGIFVAARSSSLSGRTKTAKKPAARPPSRARSRSRCPSERRSRNGAAPFPARWSASRTSLWPSMNGTGSDAISRATLKVHARVLGSPPHPPTFEPNSKTVTCGRPIRAETVT